MLPLVSPGAVPATGPLAVPPVPARVGLFAAVLAVLAGYFTWSWSGGRATLPQKTWRLQLASRNGGAPSPAKALARFLAAWIGPAMAVAAYLLLAPHALGAHATWLVAFNYLWALVDRDRQFLHDRVAGTVLLGP